MTCGLHPLYALHFCNLDGTFAHLFSSGCYLNSMIRLLCNNVFSFLLSLCKALRLSRIRFESFPHLDHCVVDLVDKLVKFFESFSSSVAGFQSFQNLLVSTLSLSDISHHNSNLFEKLLSLVETKT